MNEQQAAVWAAMNQVYKGFLARDPTGVDALMHPDVTIWDSDEPAMAHGLAELQKLRAARPSAADARQVSALDATEPVIDVWGDTALVRHLLRVSFSAGPDQVVRNTSVWRLVDGRWLAVHNHEDVLS
jgi:ketosteroid isomerase-like protein